MQPHLVTYAVATDPENLVYDNKVQYYLCNARDEDHAIDLLHRDIKNAAVIMVYICTPVA